VQRRGFHTTNWSLILAAAAPGNQENDALADLCAQYWPPVQAFIRREGHGAADADDLTQGFFARLLEKGYVAQADRARGRFRSFLLAAVKHFLANERERAAAQKRGGTLEHVPVDHEDAEGALTPEQAFHRRWALHVIDRVLERVKEEGPAGQLERLLPFVTGEADRGDYADVAAATGTSEGALRVAVHRLRGRFRHHLREIVAATVADAHQVDDEIRFLIDAVAGGRSRFEP
jgi:DNA-directed RNA polymerase specialized sigma24 family protein